MPVLRIVLMTDPGLARDRDDGKLVTREREAQVRERLGELAHEVLDVLGAFAAAEGPKGRDCAVLDLDGEGVGVVREAGVGGERLGPRADL